MNFVIHQQELDTLAGYHQKEGASYQKVEAAINRYVKNPHSLQAEISIKYEDYLKICDEGYESGRIVEFWLSRYSLVKAIKGLFDNLAFRGRNLESSPKNMNARDFGYFNALTPKIWIDEKGLVQKADAHILTVLIGKDITRIRQCAVCRNFFWANRKDRKCCSKKCADVNNQRNIRSKKKDNECLYKNPKKIMTSKKECSKVF